MRTIKFRAWHTTMKKMFSPEEMVIDQMALLPDGRFCNVHGSDTRLSTFPPMIPMQFTGLHDKDGKEIYEGDIIRFKVDFPEQEFDNGIVRWADGGFWTSQTEDDLEELLSDELKELGGEMIGNIHANPELLK